MLESNLALAMMSLIIIAQIVIFLTLMILVQDVQKIKTARLWGDNPIYDKVKDQHERPR